MPVCARANVFNHLNVLDALMCQDLRLIHSMDSLLVAFSHLPFCPCDGGTRELTGEFLSFFLGSELLETWHYFHHGMLSHRDGKLFLCLKLGLLSWSCEKAYTGGSRMSHLTQQKT